MTSTTVVPTDRRHPAGRHLAALIIGCLLILPGVGLLLGGGAISIAYAVGRDSAGFLSLSYPVVSSSSPAVTVGDAIIETGPDAPSWVLDRLDLDVRITAQPLESGKALFLGIAPTSQLNAYLSGVAHEQVVGTIQPTAGNPRTLVMRAVPGADRAPAPTSQKIWVSSATGTGSQQLTWKVSEGRWGAAVMNADGSPGVAVSATTGVKAGFLLPLALLMLGIGLVVTGLAVLLIVRGASGSRPASYTQTPGAPAGYVEPDSAPVQSVPTPPPPSAWHSHPRAMSPVALDARLDEPLSRWLWLVKWFLAIPHFFVLGVLWIAFFVVCVIAFFAILFTGRYPRSLFEFNRGVLQWNWRVSYYCANGGLGTDRYPPFSLGPEPDYPARLDIAYPQRLSRGLVLVKWWLLAIPHYLILGLLLGGGGWAWNRVNDNGYRFDAFGWGILGLLVAIAGLSLLFTGRYPRALFDLVIGLNRWVYRVVAYATLMTDVYPPFQLDEGGPEVPLPPPVPASRLEPPGQVGR